MIEQAHQEAYEVLFDNRDILDRLVVELLEKETLDKEQVAGIFSELRLRQARPAWTGSARRRPHERGPVDYPAARTATGPDPDRVRVCRFRTRRPEPRIPQVHRRRPRAVGGAVADRGPDAVALTSAQG